ncbi:MAG: tryptophan--tRNA ligase [Gammaproteobacteria bacterium]|nr:tryptophan--tRNA ligase [Gammaproteobacteria bacterium]MBU1489141.1 tryptophan--tRNA ligase [Gammaproteobacteria bacterium]MBU2066516.1 tryptophan--tRNA ligase [Gammaproteobacteria bacterium]MBU2139432.1 tryptophan--tRNA ligase [Gammaproteobacteria bacterium]MBU2217988.1 tryptophan--tRNA ligase [Gammaproteobacteria bacterium]
MTTRILTGITTTGTPHLGNYAGAIRPAIVASRAADADSFYFLADYHALIKCDEPARIQRSRLEIAATWLALGLDTDKATFYRQSDIPEIPELCWLLTCVVGKGLLNRAHAYKASVDKNVEAGEDPDAGITMGLFSYPVLMAADILMFNAHKVPVGRDQIQHVEMARDIAQRFNHLFGQGKELFTLPEAVIEEDVATLPGLDGRKMSKSYDNTIPLFGSAKQLKDAVARIVTDSKLPGEPKDPDNSHLFTLYQAFAAPTQQADFRAALEGGIAWGEAKQALVSLLEAELGEARERYHALIAKPADLEDILLAGAAKARKIATPFLGELREAVGLRSFREQVQVTSSEKKKSAKGARFVSFRDEDGRFRFRLLDADGEQLLLSKAFADGKAAGQVSKRLQSDELDVRPEGAGFSLWLDDEEVASSPAFADDTQRDQAIARLYEALTVQ